MRKAVNQFEFEEYHNRRPDIVLFINGIPVSVFELKNPVAETVSIADAYSPKIIDDIYDEIMKQADHEQCRSFPKSAVLTGTQERAVSC